MPDVMDGMSMDLERANMDKLRSVFPECFAEGKLDIDKLLSLCGEYVSSDFEKYKFEWKGKAECLKLAQKRSAGTLRPCPEESVDWETTQNLYIEGDNLEVLKLLQTAYYRKVKMIYIDPPYNTGKDFVYSDDFADPMARYKEVTQQTTKSNPETMGRFHTNWLNMMYPRLRLAANLLRDDGVIFISIDGNEVMNLRKVCDEVFGEENCLGIIANINNPKGRSDDNYIATAHEYIVVYAKSVVSVDWYGFEPTEEITKRYNKVDSEGKRYREIDLRKTGENDLREDRPNLFYYFYFCEDTGDFYASREDIIKDGYIQIKPQREDGCEGNWRWGIETATSQIGELIPKFMPARKVWGVMQKDYLEGRSLVKPTSSWTFKDVNSERGTEEFVSLGFDKRIFPKPKPIGTIKRCLQLSTGDEDIVLDFFSGSGSTAHAVMQLNAQDGNKRKYILVQLPEICDQSSEAYKAGYKNICEIGKERIRRAGKKVWLDLGGSAAMDLAVAMTFKEWEDEMNESAGEKLDTASSLDKGFRVFKLDTSNLQTWDSTPVDELHMDDLLNRMNSMVNRVKADRSDMDMVCEIMLKLGVPLTSAIMKVEINDKAAYTVQGDSLLLVCLAADVTPEDVEAMAAYAPAKVVISRDSFANDTAMANAHYILRDRGIELKLV